MSTANATEASVNGRGARQRLIVAAKIAATQPSTNPNRPATFCRVLMSASRSFGDRCCWRERSTLEN